jgi:hypothetical protein
MCWSRVCALVLGCMEQKALYEAVYSGSALHPLSASVVCHVAHCRVRVAPGATIPDDSFLVLEHCHQTCAADGACMHIGPVAVPLRPDDTSVSLPVYGDAESGARNAIHLLWGSLEGDRGARARAVASGQHVGVGHVFDLGLFSIEIVRIEDVEPRDPAALEAACRVGAWDIAEDVLEDDDDDDESKRGKQSGSVETDTNGTGAGDHPCAWYHVRRLESTRLPPLRMVAPDRAAYDRARSQVDAECGGGDEGFNVLVKTFARAAIRASRIVLGPVFVSLDHHHHHLADGDEAGVLFVHPARLCLPLADGATATPYLARDLVLHLVRMRLAALGHGNLVQVELQQHAGRAFLVFHQTTPVDIHPTARLPACAIELNTRTPAHPLDASTGIAALDAELGIQRNLLKCNTRIGL